MKADERRVDNHMEQVRAVHRRSAYERVVGRIAFYSAWDREAKVGLRPPLPDDCHDHLSGLLALKAELEAELIAHGQSIR